MTVRRNHYSGTTAIATAFMLAWLPFARPTAFALRGSVDFASGKAQGQRVELPDIVADLEQGRQTVVAQREALGRLLTQPRFAGTEGDRLRRAMDRLDKAWLYLKIAHSSGATRHELIRQLPVTITSTRAVDGRLGSYREYAANGKVRIRVFVPDAAPAMPSDTWDRNLEQPDGSASVDHRLSADCYYEDEDGAFSGTCVTQQEVDDSLIVEADLLAEEPQMEADADAAYAEIEEWCQLNYPDCENGETKGDEEEVPLSGPSVWENEGLAECSADKGPLECLAQGVAAVQAAGYAVVSRVKLYNLANSSAILTVSAGALAWKVTLAVGSVAAAAIFIGASWECFSELE